MTRRNTNEDLIILFCCNWRTVFSFSVPCLFSPSLPLFTKANLNEELLSDLSFLHSVLCPRQVKIVVGTKAVCALMKNDEN